MRNAIKYFAILAALLLSSAWPSHAQTEEEVNIDALLQERGFIYLEEALRNQARLRSCSDRSNAFESDFLTGACRIWTQEVDGDGNTILRAASAEGRGLDLDRPSTFANVRRELANARTGYGDTSFWYPTSPEGLFLGNTTAASASEITRDLVVNNGGTSPGNNMADGSSWVVSILAETCLPCMPVKIFMQLTDILSKGVYVMLAKGMVVIGVIALAAAIYWEFGRHSLLLAENKEIYPKLIRLLIGSWLYFALLTYAMAFPFEYGYEVIIGDAARIATDLIAIGAQTCSSWDPSLRFLDPDNADDVANFSYGFDIEKVMGTFGLGRILDDNNIKLIDEKIINGVLCQIANIQKMMTAGMIVGGYGIWSWEAKFSLTGIAQMLTSIIMGAIIVGLFFIALIKVGWSFLDLVITLAITMALMPVGLLGLIFPPLWGILTKQIREIFSAGLEFLTVAIFYLIVGVAVCTVPLLMAQKVGGLSGVTGAANIFDVLEQNNYAIHPFDPLSWALIFAGIFGIGLSRKANEIVRGMVGSVGAGGAGSLGATAERISMSAVGAAGSFLGAAGGAAAGVAGTYLNAKYKAMIGVTPGVNIPGGGPPGGGANP